MKKFFITSLFAIIYQAYALFGIGVHVGLDDTSVSSQKINLLQISSVDYTYNLTRDEIKNPLALGAQLYFDLPVVPIGFELGFEGAWAKYSWKGDDKLIKPNGDVIPLQFKGYKSDSGIYDEEFEFAKIGVDVTGKWYIFSLPPVVKTFKIYVGGGAGFYMITPVVTDKMIIHELEKAYDAEIPTETKLTLDVDDYIENVTVIGYHVVGGIQMKIPALPISFNVDYKYVMTPENDYGDPTNDFGVIKGSINFYM